jgi:hypothetical protein
MSTNANYGPNYEKLRAEIKAEINENKVNIDKTVFKKTPEERKQLNKLKSEYKNLK